MRNLKRVLSLTLASVMLLGMMVVGASAADKTYADLTDSADIKNQEAVALMVDLGIITGKPNGSYAPAETVDRATMAKLITFIMMGDVDQNSFKGTATNLTDVSGNWAEGYIKFCYSNGIISGDGAGHFFPTQPVTVVAAAKMLLVALGYDAKDRGYENDANWSVNIMRDAQSTKEGSAVRALTKGLNVKATDPLSRDNAAQMIFNALFVHTVKPEYAFDMGQRYIAKYAEQASMAATNYGGLERKTATLTEVDDGEIVQPSALAGLAASSADLGKTVVYYVDSDGALVSKAAVAGGTTVLATLTDGTATGKTLEDAADTLKVELDADPAYYVNGKAPQADPTTAKRGALVEFIDSTGDGKANVIRITEKKLAVVGAISTRVVDKKTQVSIGGITGYTAEANVPGYDSLSKDDVVLFYQDGDGVYHIEKAESVEGEITSKNSSKKTATVNGKAYKASGLTLNGSYTDVTAYDLDTAEFETEYAFYLDNYDNIIASKVIEEEKTSNNAILLQTAWVDGSGAIGESKYAQAELLHMDGTTEVVKLATVGGKKVVKTADSDTVAYNDTTNIPLDVFYSYTEGKNGVELTVVENPGTVTAAATKPGKTDAVAGVTSNSSTVFIVKTADKDGKDVYTAYTGIANVPNGNVTEAGTAIVKNGFASHVFVTMTLKAKTDDAIYAYVVDAADMDSDGKVDTYNNVYVDGVKTTLQVKVYEGAAAITLTDNTLYKVRLTDGVLESIKDASNNEIGYEELDTADYSGIEAVAGGSVKMGTRAADGTFSAQKSYIYTNSTNVYVFEFETKDGDTTLTSAGVGSLTATPKNDAGTNSGDTTFTYTDEVFVFETEEDSGELDTVIIIRTTEVGTKA